MALVGVRRSLTIGYEESSPGDRPTNQGSSRHGRSGNLPVSYGKTEVSGARKSCSRLIRIDRPRVVHVLERIAANLDNLGLVSSSSTSPP